MEKIFCAIACLCAMASTTAVDFNQSPRMATVGYGQIVHAANPNPATRLSATAQAVTATADLAGEYVMIYQTLLTSGYDGGLAVTVTPIDGTDSIEIANFWDSGVTVKAHADIEQMKITIPNQTIGYSYTYGYYDLALCTTSGAPDRTAPIEGEITADGIINITSWWGAYITNGDYADQYYGLYCNTAIEPANATMTQQAYSATAGSVVSQSYSVIVEPTSRFTLSVKNFGNYGATIEVDIAIDSTATIASQYAYSNSYGDIYTYSAEFSDDYSSLTKYTETITCDKATDSRTISWGQWTLIGGGYYWLTGVSGKIETASDITYPTLTNLSLQGDGTADSPYLIGTTDEWNNLADYMADRTDSINGKYVKLTADLDFTGATMSPLGYDATSVFNGDLDGNGKTIKGFSNTSAARYSGAVIVRTGKEANIHDLTVEGEMQAYYYPFVSGVVGKLYGKIDNVVSRVDITTDKSYAAGVVAYASEGATVTRCAYEGTINSQNIYIGGIAAYSEAGVRYEDCVNRGTLVCTSDEEKTLLAGLISYCYPDTIINCHNEGTLTVTSESAGGVSGLIGYAGAAKSDNPYYIKNCYNTGDITSAYNNAGIILSGSTYTKMTMEECYNTGNITSTYTSTVSSRYTAGVAALYFRTSAYRNCWNSGDITTSGTDYTAGVLGYYCGTGSADATTEVSGCCNTGQISATGLYAAGIVARQGSYTYLDSCYNTGSIAGDRYVAGISSYINAPSAEISRCWNAGDVTAVHSYAAGILAYTIYSVPVTDCFNVGEIASTSTTQGTTASQAGYAIGGIAGRAAAQLTRVYNTASITGASCVGGIIGAPYTTMTYYTTLKSAYSTGKVTAPADTCGNIVGASLINNGSVWPAQSSIADTYFLAENNCVADTVVNDTTSVGLTRAELASLDMGEGWMACDDFTYPVPESLADNDFALAYAAAILPAEGDSYSSITGLFGLGTPDGVEWSASSSAVEIDGNTAKFTASFTGTLEMTATRGQASSTTTLECDVVVDGVDTAGCDAPAVVDEQLYNLDGTRRSAAAACRRGVYIVVKTLEDGSTSVAKEIR